MGIAAAHFDFSVKEKGIKGYFDTSREPESLKILTEGVPVYSAAEAAAHADEVDVLILCGGSATDLPAQTPEMAKYFNVIDSFDTHARIPL